MNLSIIIPHYNVPKYLNRLLGSIVSENNTNQIIVVDDRSTDNLEIYEKVQRKMEKTTPNKKDK